MSYLDSMQRVLNIKMIVNKISLRLNRIHPQSLIQIRHLSDSALETAKKPGTDLNLQTKPRRGPFMKNIFLGEFDLEALVYPELDKDSLQELKKKVSPYKDYFKKNVDPKTISQQKSIPQRVQQDIKNLKLFGQLIPFSYGGAQQTATETACISEVLAKDLNIALTLYSHNFHAVQSLLLYGSQEQKDKYLPRLASGEWIAAFALTEESSGADLLSSSTQLHLSDTDSSKLLLNGKKRWVVNGKNANLFIVSALTQVKNHQGDTVPRLRLVIVEKNSPGVELVVAEQSLGLNASNICDVHFSDVSINPECLLGDERHGVKMCVDIVNSGRYNLGAITLSLLKDLTQTVTNFIANREQTGKPLMECELIHNKLADISTTLYTLESMTYHTALTLDFYEDPDCSLELAIIKLFCFTEGKRCLDILMDLMGARSVFDSDLILKYFQDFRTLEVFDGSTDATKLYVSLMGLQHSGTTVNKDLSKIRNPFDNPGYIFKRLLNSKGHIMDNPKLHLKLFEQLHPSLTDSANKLEYCVIRFNFAVNTLFGRHGSEIVSQQLDLKRLADAAVKIYAMTCVLARASRSYCIGLRNAETELRYAIMLCSNYHDIVKKDLNELLAGEKCDIGFLKAGPDVVSNKGYFLEHPLERSF